MTSLIDRKSFIALANEIAVIANKRYGAKYYSAQSVEVVHNIVDNLDGKGFVVRTIARLYGVAAPYPIAEANVMGDFEEALKTLRDGLDKAPDSDYEDDKEFKFSKLN